MVGRDIRALFLEHRHELQVYLTQKLRDRQIAEELTQEVFLRFAEQGAAGQAAISHPRSYLYRTAHNLAVDHIRRLRHQPVGSLPDEEMAGVADDRPTPDRVADSRSDVAAAREALLQLPERTRQIFVLTRIDGLTYAEVAARLRISSSSVQKHLAQAIRHVMVRLRDE